MLHVVRVRVDPFSRGGLTAGALHDRPRSVCCFYSTYAQMPMQKHHDLQNALRSAKSVPMQLTLRSFIDHYDQHHTVHTAHGR